MIASDNSMAGNENADAISSDGTCHGSDAVRFAYTYSYFLIASCLSIGYFEQCMPYLFLKISSYRMQRNIKYLAVTGNNSSLKFEIMAKQLYVASQRVL